MFMRPILAAALFLNSPRPESKLLLRPVSSHRAHLPSIASEMFSWESSAQTALLRLLPLELKALLAKAPLWGVSPSNHLHQSSPTSPPGPRCKPAIGRRLLASLFAARRRKMFWFVELVPLWDVRPSTCLAL